MCFTTSSLPFFVFVSFVVIISFLLLINAQSTCELPTCCNLTMRNTAGPNGYPRCIIVGIITDQGDEARYFTRDLPFTVWNATVRGVPELAAVPIFYNQTQNSYDSGLEGLRRQEYDVYIADIWALSRRAVGVDWSIGYYREFIGLGFVVSTRSEPTFLALFDPFQPIIWILAVALLVFGGILLFAVEWMHPISDDVPPAGGRLVYRFAFWRSVLRCFDNALMSPFGEGRMAVQSTAGALVVFGLKFFFLILLESYVANLASFLTVAGAGSQTNLADLLRKGILSQDNGNVDFAQASGGKIVTTTESPNPTVLKRHLAGLNSNNVASYVQGSGQLLSSVDRDCDMRFLRLPYSVDTSLSFREHPVVAQVRRAVDFMTLTLRQNGTMGTYVDKTFMDASLRCSDSRLSADERVDDPSSLQLGVSNMRGLFVITLGLMALAIVIAIVLRFAAQILYGAYSAQEMWDGARPFLKDISEAPSGVELRRDPNSWKSRRIRDRESKVK